MKHLRAAFALVCLFAGSGCSVVTYGLGVATMVNDMNVRAEEDYAKYRSGVEEANRERAERDLAPEKPLTFRQWSRQQAD